MDLDNNKEIQAYLAEVCSQVKFRDVHQDVEVELKTHIQEIAEEYLAQGFSPEEAVTKALAQMGSAHTVGKQLNQVHKPKPEWSILAFALLFIGLGLATMYAVQKQSLLPYNIQIFERSLPFALLALTAIIGLYFFDYRKMKKYSLHIYLGTLLLLILTMLWGTQALGSRSWLRIGPFSVNFVAISPLLFMIAFAGIFQKWNWSNSFKFLQGLVLFAVPLLLFLTVPSLATGFVYIAACTVLMLVSGAKLKEALLVPGSFLVILCLAIISQPYRISRLLTYLNPGSDPEGGGYINIQLSKILADSGLWGQGFTFEPKILPELHTDFVFTFITYTFGWVVSILFVALVITFLARVVMIAKQVKTDYARLLLSSMVTILTIQFTWNIFMNLGLVPIGEVGLPFISYGGSQLLINGATIGLISSIYKRRNISQGCKLS